MIFKLAGQNYLFIAALAVLTVMSGWMINQAFAPGGGRAPNVTDGNVAYTVWPAKDGAETTDMLFAVSVNGVSDGYINLSETPVYYSEDPEISYDGKVITITWWERTYNADGNIEMNTPVSTRSVDGGLTFEPIINLDLLEDRADKV